MNVQDRKEKLIQLRDKLEMYEELKHRIGYDESSLQKPANLSEELFNSEILDDFPRITQRRLFNNSYLNECIRQIKERIKQWEAL